MKYYIIVWHDESLWNNRAETVWKGDYIKEAKRKLEEIELSDEAYCAELWKTGEDFDSRIVTKWNEN